ncbi:MAG: hypothetical protein ABJH63_15195 [Rhizobiaceae bacterium]
MKILIVHDRLEIGDAIELLVTTSDPATIVSRAADHRSARDLLKEKIFDLLIIDLTIPFTPNSSDATYDAVENLLGELFEADSLHVPGDIIGITQDLDVLDRIGSSIGPHLMVAIEEDNAGKWKRYLLDKIEYAARAARTRYISINQQYDYDVIIVTAMDVESEPYREIFDAQDLKHFRGAKEFLFNDKFGLSRKGILYSIGRSGQASAASLTQALISTFRPQIALMSGYCGGVKGKVELGDIVFFEGAYAWDYGKWDEEGEPPIAVFRARPDPIAISGGRLHDVARTISTSNFSKSPEILKKAGRLSAGKLDKFNVFIKPAASGSAVVAAEEIVAQIRGLSDSVWAVDMEAYGFYSAASQTRVKKPEFMCVKSVSDYSNGEKGDGYHNVCSFLSASIVWNMITEIWEYEADATS